MIGRQPWIRQASRQAKDSFGRTCHYNLQAIWRLGCLQAYILWLWDWNGLFSTENKWTDSWKMQNSTHFTYLSLISTTNKFCFFQNKIDKFFKCIPGTFSVKHFGFRHVLVVAIWFATILLSGSCLVNFSTAGWAVALGIRFFAARFCTLRR